MDEEEAGKTIAAPKKSWARAVIVILLLAASAGLFYYAYLGWQALTML